MSNTNQHGNSVLKDEEIIKAMECCENIKDSTCKHCCFYRDSHCVANMAKNALDLINRQKAEIERLQKILVGFMDEVGTWSNKYDVDISNIHRLPLLAKEDFNIRNKIKSEAIKEFAERLKEQMFSYYECVSESAKGRPYKGDTLMDYEVVDMIEDCIDNIVKEMAGE